MATFKPYVVESNLAPKGDKGSSGTDGTNGIDGINGTDGDTVKSITRTSGDGSSGSTDTWTMWGDLAETESLGTFSVYNGSDGDSSGDMTKSVYDPNNKASDTFDQDNMVSGSTNKNYTTTEQSKLSGIESGATADQTDSEIEIAYNNQVSVVTQAVAEAGTSTTVQRWTPERVTQAVAKYVDDNAGAGIEIMHVHYQVANGINGGNSVIGENDRPINTVLQNTITGASLSTNQITLPIGMYFLNGGFSSKFTTKACSIIRRVSGAILTDIKSEAVSGDNQIPTSAVINIESEVIIKFITTSEQADATGVGLGQALNLGSNEVFANITITKIG